MFRQTLWIAALSLLASIASAEEHADIWVVLQYETDGYPVVMKAMQDLPPASVQEKFPWLTVVSWNYDRDDNNGVPLAAINEQMIALEDAIHTLEKDGLCLQVYSKTGNGLKELVYYIGDRDVFMAGFNNVLADHPPYPLDIVFYEDAQWSDLQTVHEVFLSQ